MNEIKSIFYSWQSDLPKETNQNGIRQCLRTSLNLVEENFEDYRLEIDEATRNTTGSPNIPQSIFNKISRCEIFICDVSIINSKTNDLKKTPNPNVLIELGYAIASVGWDRIIMLFNLESGNFPNDLPFDIDRHRTSPYRIKSKDDKSGKNELVKLLKIAIEPILKAKPSKPTDLQNLSPKETKRKLDVKNLKWIMDCVNVVAFDNFMEYMPSKIMGQIFFYKDWFYNISVSNKFHIYDPKLKKLLFEFRDNWDYSLSFYQYFDRDYHGHTYSFRLPFDVFPDKKTEEDFNTLTKISQELSKNFKDLLEHIRNEYLEIDLDDTSRNALEEYNKYHSKE
jgi:hypothetical protein